MSNLPKSVSPASDSSNIEGVGKSGVGKPAAALIVRGLQCDGPGCGYRGDELPYADYDAYLDAPCPDCGASLLTSEDLAAIKLLAAVVDYTNAIVGLVPHDATADTVRLSMNGTGAISIAPPICATNPKDKTGEGSPK